jgi:hypothetical protein
MLTRDAKEIKMKIIMDKEGINIQISHFTGKLIIELRNKLFSCYIRSIALHYTKKSGVEVFGKLQYVML